MTRDEEIFDAAFQYASENYSQVDNDFQFAINNAVIKAFKEGAKWSGIWHNAYEECPPIDEEVIVLLETPSPSHFEISFAHIVNKEIYVDYNGWNIKGVKYWIPCPQMPDNNFND